MAHVELPPEAADGGYWYVVGRVGSGVMDDEYRPDLPAHATNWTASDVEYGGQTLFLVRTPDPVLGVAQVEGLRAETLVAQLGYGRKPRGRVRGR